MNIRRTLATGLAAIILSMTVPVKAEDNCHQWDFYESSVKVCMADKDEDGMAEYSRIQRFNLDGNLLSQETDRDGDGNPNYKRNKTSDSEGRLVFDIVDRNGDGKIDFSRTITYDSDGRIASDDILDGENSIKREYKYGEDGNVSSMKRITEDGTREFFFRLNKYVIRQTFDTDSDGTPEVSLGYEYNLRGQRTGITRDEGADGTDDHRWQLMRGGEKDGYRKVIMYDKGADGSIDEVFVF